MQRLNHISDDLAVVRHLLMSASACALKAKQKIDHLTQKVDRVAKFATLTQRC